MMTISISIEQCPAGIALLAAAILDFFRMWAAENARRQGSYSQRKQTAESANDDGRGRQCQAIGIAGSFSVQAFMTGDDAGRDSADEAAGETGQ